MDEFIIIINKIFKDIKALLYKFYTKLNFMLNKQKTLQKIYKPLTDSKIKINDDLLNKLNTIKKENKTLKENIQELVKENNILENKISIMQELLLKK